MAFVHARGSCHAPVWVIVEEPYEQDEAKGFIFSAGYGYTFDKMMSSAGLHDYYVISRRGDLSNPDTYTIVESQLNQFKPPIIILLGESLGWLCPETKKKKIKGKDEKKAALDKYTGSILYPNDKLINYPSYVVPTLAPDVIVRDWSERDICVNLDLGKAKDELDYYRQHGCLQPLPTYEFDFDFDSPGGFHRLNEWLDRFETAKLLSVDIESVYTLAKSAYYPHPGYPVTIGMADNSREGISFRLFRENRQETCALWRRLDVIFRHVRCLGQNFFDFDATRLNSLGFSIDYKNIEDTLIRHHILWPELPHKLQFQTKQYTRQPYYKDEGHGWGIKDMKRLMHYNCLDVCVTFEIYMKQEEEFNARPYLRGSVAEIQTVV